MTGQQKHLTISVALLAISLALSIAQRHRPSIERDGPPAGRAVKQSEEIEAPLDSPHETPEGAPQLEERGQRKDGMREGQHWGGDHAQPEEEESFVASPTPPDDQLAELCSPPRVVVTNAVVVLSGHSDRSGDVSGYIDITQNGGSGPIIISGNVSGLTPGNHGFHVFMNGNLKDGCASAGSHFELRVSNSSGGQSSDTKRYAGDLDNLNANNKGFATFTISDSVLSLNGDFSIIGRMFVIDEEADNYGGFGQTNDVFDESDVQKIACGVVARTKDSFAKDRTRDEPAEGSASVEQYEAVLNGAETVNSFAFNVILCLTTTSLFSLFSSSKGQF